MTIVAVAPVPGGSRTPSACEIEVAGARLVADPAGALYWPAERLLVIADLHLEKGSGFASRGSLLPPYDTADTLARLEAVLARYRPLRVVALGDNFHDGGGAGRLAAEDRATLARLTAGRDTIWIAGNHDPEPMAGLGGTFAATLQVGPLTFRHEPRRGAAVGEVAGHLHPVAVVAARGTALRRRCFVGDGRRLVLPAFGAYAGGLNVRHHAFAGLLSRDFTAHVIGRGRVFPFPASACIGN